MPDPTCPICRKPASAAHRPFCSPRCADIDLGRWFTGAYAVPGPEADPDEVAALMPPEPPRPAGRSRGKR